MYIHGLSIPFCLRKDHTFLRQHLDATLTFILHLLFNRTYACLLRICAGNSDEEEEVARLIDIGDVEALKDKLTGVTDLGLYRWGIGDDAVKVLSLALQSNRTLKRIWLYNNNIGNDGAKALATALLTSDTVTYIDLDNNDIDNKLLKKIKEALAVNGKKIGTWKRGPDLFFSAFFF